MTDDDDAPPPPELHVDQAFAGAYQELRRLARSRLRGGGRNTVLDTTALVHETFLKLSRNAGVSFPDRPRCRAYAGRAMRSFIVDMVRQCQTERAGGADAMLARTCQEAAGHHRRLFGRPATPVISSRTVAMCTSRPFAGKAQTPPMR